MRAIVPKQSPTVTPGASARIDRAVRIIAGPRPRALEAVAPEVAAQTAERALAQVAKQWPRAGVIARLVDEVIATDATPAERLRLTPELAKYGLDFWNSLRLEDCAWLAYMLLRSDAEYDGRWDDVEKWQRCEDEATADARKYELALAANTVGAR